MTAWLIGRCASLPCGKEIRDGNPPVPSNPPNKPAAIFFSGYETKPICVVCLHRGCQGWVGMSWIWNVYVAFHSEQLTLKLELRCQMPQKMLTCVHAICLHLQTSQLSRAWINMLWHHQLCIQDAFTFKPNDSHMQKLRFCCVTSCSCKMLSLSNPQWLSCTRINVLWCQ